MLNFRLFGFPVSVEPFFWLTMALVFGAMDVSSPESLRVLILVIGAGFISILIHELGHALTMRHLGDQRVEIVLHGFGGMARGSRYLNRWQDLVVSAAGPAAQYASGLLVSLWILPAAGGELNQSGRIFLASFANTSKLWAIINLLPILPLDGGHICRSLIGTKGALKVSLVLAGLAAVYFLLAQALIGTMLMAMLAHQSWKALQTYRN
jgi:Zn-dependent protease